jgi:hypothetical protein
MMKRVLIWVQANRVAFLVVAVMFGAVLGFFAGLLAYEVTLLITPNATEKQLKVIIPAFTVLGIGIGLYMPLADLWQKSRLRKRL